MSTEVDEYVEKGNKKLQPLYRRLEALVLELYPDIRVVMSDQIPTYRGRAGWLGLGYSEKGVSIYTNGPQHVAEFKKSHPDIGAAKSSIEFKSEDEIPEADLKKVIRHAIEHSDAPGRRMMGRR